MRTNSAILGALIATVLLLGLATRPGEAANINLDPSNVIQIFGFDAPAPKVDNPVTPEKVALGRALYHEKKLSTNDNISCASCHALDNFGQDGLAVSPGTDGVTGDRNAPTSLNAFLQFRQFWDGRAESVEDQATGPILNPIEHGLSSEAQVVEILKGIPGMNEQFAKAFPGQADPVTLTNVGYAIGAFERTLRTRSRWDDFLDGDDDALNAAEKKGLERFLTTGCITCHMFKTVGGGIYQKLGLVKPYETEDLGRYKVTGNEADKYYFKVPSLLNVEKTGPYFHDGSITKLETAVQLMARHQLGKELGDAEIREIVTFLKALTGELPASQ
jgi:cytochrome c peroxidase